MSYLKKSYRLTLSALIKRWQSHCKPIRFLRYPTWWTLGVLDSWWYFAFDFRIVRESRLAIRGIFFLRKVFMFFNGTFVLISRNLSDWKRSVKSEWSFLSKTKLWPKENKLNFDFFFFFFSKKDQFHRGKNFQKNSGNRWEWKSTEKFVNSK